MIRNFRSRNGFAGIEGLFALMFLSIAFAVFIAGVKYGRFVFGSKLAALSCGVVAELLFWAAFSVICGVSASVLRWRSNELSFTDAACGIAADGIVIVWIAGVLATILYGIYELIAGFEQ
jgi:hypothetical protein